MRASSTSMSDTEDAHVKVMVVEDDPEVAKAIARRLGASGDRHELEIIDEPFSVLARLEAGTADWDVMLLDVGLPGMSGIEVLKRFREAGSPVSIIMLTGDQTAATATECMRAGAFYYLTKPFRSYELSSMVVSGARHSQLRRQLERRDAGGSESVVVGTSSAMRRLHSAVERLASQDVSILIQGESGTGKELVARALHAGGPRRKARFVALNCGAIPESLIDSELFGHARGAFTGATTDRAGVFVEADGGTLFLDEIGDMPISVQARLLRVLQEGEVRPVGSSGVRSVDVRVIAATHVDLAAAVEAGRFRQDLYYRLNVVVLAVPPLRERLEDLPLLAAHFLRKHGGKHPPSLAPDTLEVMASYEWPGNVRELENAVMHAIALHHGEVIGPESLPQQIQRARGRPRLEPARRAPETNPGEDDLLPLTEAKRRASMVYERRYLIRVMERARGSVSEAARLAGLDRTNFRRLLQRHGLEASTFK
jgi:two-component system, NtrC family, response regulator HydG